jgi:glucose 1-dehydrogenase
MRALTVIPGVPLSARLDDIPEPSDSDGAVLVHTLLIGVCGTDRDIVFGKYGSSPPGRQRLVLGHESLGRVLSAPAESGVGVGDLVVGIVRRPDPVPCSACACGEWDMCRNGLYTERGIKHRDGYGAERFRVEPEFTVPLRPMLGDVGVLLEPTSIVAKAWDHIDHIASRSSCWRPQIVLVTGAGPIGLLAALIGTQRGYEVHVYNRSRSGLKLELVRALGATYHAENPGNLKADIALECTGATPVILDMVTRIAPDGIVCLLGIPSGTHSMTLDVASINRTVVLENNLIFGSVNANRRHYERAAEALHKADPSWLRRLITRRVPVAQWQKALERCEDDIKVVIDFSI